MLTIKKIKNIELLVSLKQEYLTHTTAPLDGMWLCGFLPVANHYGIYYGDVLYGYFCINEAGFLLQFYLKPNYQTHQNEVFQTVIKGDFDAFIKPKGAYVSTAEPKYLSLCLDAFSKFKINALMYHKCDNSMLSQDHELTLQLAKRAQLDVYVGFAKTNIDASEQWLIGYYENLISRTELLGLWQDNKLIAVGECRVFDQVQIGYADLGVIVAKSERGKGLATQVLSFLIQYAERKGLKSICSTEKANIAAQKAIMRAGLYSSNSIIQFEV